MIGANNEEPIQNIEDKQIVVECEASENGRYQAFGGEINNSRYMIDTQTGVLYVVPNKAIKDFKNNRVWKRLSAESNFIEE
tara:strand:+ start:597 stop:839 length:243 start_codon:yes stop_codon:yes gene_type:complete